MWVLCFLAFLLVLFCSCLLDQSTSISTLFTYAQALQATDPVTAGILMDAIKSNAIYLAGDGASGEVIAEEIDATTLK